MFEYAEYRIILACGQTDMRKSINGLADIVCNKFNLDPREKAMFVFCNHGRNRIKILVWEENGFWVHFKRFERGRIAWPETARDESIMNLEPEELKNIIKTPGIMQKIKRKEIWKNG